MGDMTVPVMTLITLETDRTPALAAPAPAQKPLHDTTARAGRQKPAAWQGPLWLYRGGPYPSSF